MSGKTAVMEIIKAHMDGEDKNTKAVLSDVMDSVRETLKQEPCGDTICRSDMLDAIGHGTTYTSEELQRIIQNLPPVTQKTETVTEFADRCRECGKMRKGHWVYDETIENWRCSKCNEIPKTMGYVGTADFMAEHFRFCNHCGCSMDAPQESEE